MTAREPSRSEQLFDRARRILPGGVDSPVRAFGSVGGTPRFLASAHGAFVVDADGTELVDLVGSWGPALLGHAHPEVAEAAYEQSKKLTHTLFTVTPYENYVAVAEKLAEITPGDFEKH